MDSKPVRTVLVVGIVLALGGVLLSRASGDGSPAAGQASKFLGVAVGGTTAVEGQPGTYERVLLTPPDAEEMSVTGAWEMSADQAIRLGGLPDREERWRAIRRNLGLQPEDLIVWREVVDAVLVQIGKLKDEKVGQRSFGFSVAFPGEETSEPSVALTLCKDAESELKEGIARAMTGIEGFVEVRSEDLEPSEVLSALEIRLFDASGKMLQATEYPDPDHQGYFKFLDLPVVDPDVGSDYYLEIAKQEGKSTTWGLKETGKQYYAPVVRGKRTRVVLPVVPTKPPQDVEILKLTPPPWFGVDEAGVTTMVAAFTEQYALLGAILEELPDNPGLHLGVVAVRGSGAQPLYSVRKFLKPPERDRRARFVRRGEFRMRLECLASSNPESAGLQYLKVVWVGRAQAADLRLESRPVIQTPWGISVGVVPSVDPTLYSLGASYKLMPTLEMLAGVGIREDHPTSFVYGIALDVHQILGGLFGGAKGTGEQ